MNSASSPVDLFTTLRVLARGPDQRNGGAIASGSSNSLRVSLGPGQGKARGVRGVPLVAYVTLMSYHGVGGCLAWCAVRGVCDADVVPRSR